MVFEMFTIFFKIGAFTFGGGYAMISIIHREIVDNKAWMGDEEFLDALTIAQTTPGVLAVNASIYTGYKLKGVVGAIACLLGTVLPSFITILTIAIFFYQYRYNSFLDKVFLGIRPAIVSLIVFAVYTLMRKIKFGYIKMTFSLLTLVLIVFLKIHPILIVIAGAVLSILYNKFLKRS